MKCPKCDKPMHLTGESSFLVKSTGRWWMTQDYLCDHCECEVKTKYPSAVEHITTAVT